MHQCLGKIKMIRINKPPNPPNYLIKKQSELKNAIQKYKSIDIIPYTEKKKILNSYKHHEVKKALFDASYNKCAYCESKSEGNYLEVEHFAPKSLYPELSIDWDNLLPSCKQCNISKGKHDTIRDPIINPCNIDPIPFFKYSNLKIYPSNKAPDQNLALRTIQVCRLNRTRLVEDRIKILKALANWETEIEKKLLELNNLGVIIKTRNVFLDLCENIEAFENLARDFEISSGLCKYFLSESKVYKNAKKFINSNKKYLDNLSN